MKKTKLLTAFMLMLTLVCVIFTISSCGNFINGETKQPEQSPKPIKLDVPTVVLTDDMASWDSDDNAYEYEISIDGVCYYIENTVTSRKLTSGQTFKVRAIGDGVNYLTSSWSNTVVYVAPSLPTDSKYTVTFHDYDGSVLSQQEVSSGESAIAPVDPVRSDYVFVGWDKDFSNVVGDLNITAVYERAYTEPTFVVESVTANAGDTVNVAINVKNNPGILAMLLTVSYDDDSLTLVSASNGEALSILTMTKSKTLDNGCKFAWDGVEISGSDIKDGEILVLTFKVSNTAASGDYTVAVSYTSGDIYDNDINILTFDIESGKITIK